jgi:hypothetical protein
MSGNDGMDSLLMFIMPEHVGSYCYVPSWLVLRTDATLYPQWAMLIHIGEPWACGGKGSLPVVYLPCSP